MLRSLSLSSRICALVVIATLVTSVGTAFVLRATSDNSSLMTLAIVGLSAAMGTAAWFATRMFTRKIDDLAQTLFVFSRGNADFSTDHFDQFEDLGHVARALRALQALANDRQILRQQRINIVDKERQRRNAMSDRMLAFNETIKELMGRWEKEAMIVQSVAGELNSVSQITAFDAQDAQSASQTAAEGVSETAAGTEQLSISIAEIAEQAGNVSMIIQDSVEMVNSASGEVRELSQAATQIHHVIKLINDIAEQTNLLALNATIEAARAGEAGKGFAVVASEVKALASQTSNAINEITEQVNAVQRTTDRAVKSFDAISESIGHVGQDTTSILSAVEEQNTVTKAISEAMRRSAEGSAQASKSVAEISESIQKTADESDSVVSTAVNLSKVSTGLRSAVADFIQKIEDEAQERRESLRLDTSTLVQIDYEHKLLSAQLKDLSEHGARVKLTNHSFKEGCVIEINFDVDTSRRAEVRRLINEHEVGVQFVEPLSNYQDFTSDESGADTSPSSEASPADLNDGTQNAA